MLPVPGIEASAQIAGYTGAGGPFMLDDAEDVDLTAESLGRDWVSDYVYPLGYVLSAVTISTSGLTPATEQTPVGCLKGTIPQAFDPYTGQNYISAGFGIPVPSVAGESTEPYPGDMTTFQSLTFYACFDRELPNQRFNVILETYPGPEYPKIYWSFAPRLGTMFEKITIDLWSPDYIENAGGLSLGQLLSQTRYLAFYCFGGPVAPFPVTTLEFHVDDVELYATPPSQVKGPLWEIY